MKKILFIHHATSWGGAPINIFNIIKELDKNKFEPVFFLLKDCELVDYLNKYEINYQIAGSKFYHNNYHTFRHLETSPTPWYNFFKYFKVILSWLLSRYIFAPRELKKLDFDIYHLNSSVLSDWLKPCREKGKVVFHIQETILNKPKGLRFKLLRYQVQKNADHIVAISKHTAAKIGLPEKTSIIYNFAKLANSKPNKLSYASKQVLYVGGQTEIKGFELMVDALEFIDDEIKILFAGNYRKDSFKKSYKLISQKYRRKWRYLEKFRSSKNVEEIGLVTDIVPHIDNCVCLVSPFTTPHFSRPVIEAYANYKPVVVTQLDGIDEIVKTNNNPTGFISKQNPTELAETINKICRESNNAHFMGENGYQLAKILFSPETIKDYESVYDNL